MKIRKERHAGELICEGQKVQKSTKVQNGMGMRNKGIFLFTICYYPVASKLEATRRQR